MTSRISLRQARQNRPFTGKIKLIDRATSLAFALPQIAASYELRLYRHNNIVPFAVGAAAGGSPKIVITATAAATEVTYTFPASDMQNIEGYGSMELISTVGGSPPICMVDLGFAKEGTPYTVEEGDALVVWREDIVCVVETIINPGGGGGGVTDHGLLTGLGDDDHVQYYNQVRGDLRYSQLSHSHTIANITGLSAALTGKLDTSVVSAYMLTVLNDADAATARATLGITSVSVLPDFASATDARIATAITGKLDSSAVSAFMLTVLDDANALAARTTLGIHVVAGLSDFATATDARINAITKPLELRVEATVFARHLVMI